MSIDILIPVISKAFGRDLTPELNLFYRARASIGTALNEEGRKFFIQNYPQVVDFMESEEGQKAIAAFIDAWILSVVPKTSSALPEETS